MRWAVLFTREAQKDARKIAAAGLRGKVEGLLGVLAANPFQSPPPYEKLAAEAAGAYARRITIRHRLVYQVHEKEKAVKVIRMWSHYE